MKRLLKLFLCMFIGLSCMCGCSISKEYTCKRCKETFRGTAYTNMEGTSIYCKECAERYWNPLPPQKYKD